MIDRIGGQKIIATHSGTLLARARLSSTRRLTRHDGVVKEWRVPEGALSADELRRYSYHLRSRRAAASFARCWLLVEGETEYWLIDELARVCGYELASEGVTCVEFAQCGVSAVLKVAGHLGIEWHFWQMATWQASAMWNQPGMRRNDQRSRSVHIAEGAGRRTLLMELRIRRTCSAMRLGQAPVLPIYRGNGKHPRKK